MNARENASINVLSRAADGALALLVEIQVRMSHRGDVNELARDAAGMLRSALREVTLAPAEVAHGCLPPAEAKEFGDHRTAEEAARPGMAHWTFPKAPAPVATHEVVDTVTGEVVRTGSDRATLNRWADKKDLEYGAVRYVVRPAAR